MTRLSTVSFSFLGILCLALIIVGCESGSTKVPPSQGSAAAHKRLAPGTLPKPNHIIIVIKENKAYGQIIGNKDAPYTNNLANKGVLFRQFYAVTHPSQPNYLALFSGSAQGLTDDSCPHRFSKPNLASELRNAGYSFAIYSQSLPRTGFKGCHHGAYARKHNPAVNWQGNSVEASQNRLFDAFPQDFNKLPTIAFVIPDKDNDMHDGSIKTADKWLKSNLKRYALWAQHNNSLLIVTWDEDDESHQNHIATIVVGDHLKTGHYDTPMNHFNLLRTMEEMYALPLLGKSAQAVPITSPWDND